MERHTRNKFRAGGGNQVQIALTPDGSGPNGKPAVVYLHSTLQVVAIEANYPLNTADFKHILKALKELDDKRRCADATGRK